MKWQQREYSPQQMQQMQQEALERVRQMQQRSRQVLKRPSHPPSFFVEPQSDPPVPVQPAPSAEPHPTSSYHPQPQTPPLSSADANGGSLLDFLTCFCSAHTKAEFPAQIRHTAASLEGSGAAKPDAHPVAHQKFLYNDHPLVMGPLISYPLCSIS